MIQQQPYAAVPMHVSYGPGHHQSVPRTLHQYPATVPALVRLPLPYVPVAQPYTVMYRYPVVHPPNPIPVRVPTNVVTHVVQGPTAMSGSSAEYDSGVAFMDTSDPSLAVDVSLSLPSSPASSRGSEESPSPTTEDIGGAEDLNTAFDGRDMDDGEFEDGNQV